MDFSQMQEISQRLSSALNCLSYSTEMIQQRRHLYRELENKYNHSSFSFIRPCRYIGSKAEGSVKLGESDTDMLYVIPFTMCVDGSIPLPWFYFPVTVLKLVPCVFHPGHFKLVLVQHNFADCDILHRCFRSSQNENWLSGSETKKEITSRLKYKHNGRTKCALHRCGHSDTLEIALPCLCPSILQEWIQRNRKCSWPPAEVFQKISKMTATVIATGIRGCPDESLEWRLCFHEIELELVGSWNDTQTKLYKLLNIVKANAFKEPENKIDSFILKNLVFWLSEYYPQSNFRPENLFAWYVKAMRLLKRCVKHFYLPHYLFPLRNLIIEKIPKNQKQEILEILNDVIRQGPQVLFKCESIQWSLSMTPAELMIFKEKRDRIELLETSKLLFEPDQIRHARSMPENNCLYWNEINILYLLISKWPPVVQQKLCSLSLQGRGEWLLS